MNKIDRVSPDTPGATAASPLARVSDRIGTAAPDIPASAPTRHDGWNPERTRIFLEALAQFGVVDDAARAAGMSRRSAYALRNRAQGRPFRIAWNAALQLARTRIADEVMSRAVNGCVELIVRDGEVVAERHRFDNRLTMSVLGRLDRQVLADDEENRSARLVAEDYDQFLDIVCAGDAGDAGDPVDAVDFVETRRKAEEKRRAEQEVSARTAREEAENGSEPKELVVRFV